MLSWKTHRVLFYNFRLKFFRCFLCVSYFFLITKQLYFVDKINEIVKEFPKNSVDSEGKLIWQGNKIFPVVLQKNFEKDLDQSTFLFFATKIFCMRLKIPFNCEIGSWSIVLTELLKTVIPFFI